VEKLKKKVVLLAALVIMLLPIVALAAPKTTLEIVWMAWPQEKVDQLIEGFERSHPNIEVDMQLVPYTQIFQTLEIRLAAGETPDVYLVDGPLTPSYAARGFLLPLDSYFTPQELEGWFNASVETGKYQDKLYSIPYATSSAALYYNKDIFKEYGVSIPSENIDERLTWEEVADMAKRLTIDKDGDGQTDIWGLIIEQRCTPYQLLPLAQSKGAMAISPDGFKTEGYINSRPFIEAAEFYRNLFNEWKVSPKGIADAAKSREYFGNGKAAMMLGAEWNVSRLAAFPNLDFGISPHPYFEGGKAVTPTGSWHVGINSKTRKKDASIAFVKYITGKEAAIEWHELFGHAPARPDVYEAMPQVFGNPMWQVLFYEMSNTAVPRPVTPGYLQYNLLLTEAFDSIHYGADPTSTLNDAAKGIDRELRRFK
jgi:fructooligosaccharide transport system substrate-binding protein